MFVNPEKILIQTGLSRSQTIVDLGTGSGFYALAAADIVGPQGKVYVVDILESALSHVASEANLRRLKNIQTVRCDLELPSACSNIEGSAADFVIMANVTHQLENKSNLMAEVYRMLKTGGHLIIVDWNEKPAPLGPDAKTKVTQDQATKLGNSVNLRLVKELKADDCHYGLLFVK